MNNIVPILINQTDDLHDEILAEVGAKKARGVDIDVYDYINLLDLTHNFTKIRDWFIKEHLITRREWNRALEIRMVRDDLGGDPKTPSIFLELYCKKNNITVNCKKTITYTNALYHEGFNLNDELAKIVQDIETAESHELPALLQQQRIFQDIQRCKSTNLTIEDLARGLRIKAKELDLRFSNSDIDDVIQQWLKNEQDNRRVELFLHIRYSNQRMANVTAKNMLSNLVLAVFEEDDNIGNAMQVAILETFIQQVKRKMQNLLVTNHLMPIIVGPQGVGKTTWVRKFISPLADVTAETDFRQLTDDRNITLFTDHFIGVCDEMPRTIRTEIDAFKHVVSALHLVRRVMHSNNVITIRQNLTFIGTSNREINQLIRDETGMRRFVALRFKKHPDLTVVNTTDYYAIWQSVDELGPDPLDQFRDRLKATQEDTRTMNPCEEWIYTLTHNFNDNQFIGSPAFYLIYRGWEVNHYSNKRLDHDDWDKELRRLILNSDHFPIEMIPNNKGYQYRMKTRTTN